MSSGVPSCRAAVLASIAAATLPSLLAYNIAPSPTFWNQALAFGLWGGVATLTPPLIAGRKAWPLLAALLALTACTAWSWGQGGLPASLALSVIGSLAAAVVLVTGGTAARGGVLAVDLFAGFCLAWVVAGGLNVVIALIQVFWPDLPDGDWIARSGYPGRAVGNLRQPNHLSSLLLWSCIGTIGLLELRRLTLRWAAPLLAVFVFAVVLTASRTGLVSVVLLALWGLLDRRLAKPTRWLLAAAPLIYALSWLGMAQWAELSRHSFGGSQRLAETDISSSRFAIWRDTLGLIRMNPWTGVGWGEFNIAWSLTPFPHRPVAFFDHTHNLILQLVVELGWPLAIAVMGLLCAALWLGARRAWKQPGDLGTAQRSAMMMVLMIGLHSLLEYPLWYAYFLLPTAWAWGFALQGVDAEASPTRSAPLRLAVPPPQALSAAGLVVTLCAILALIDYARVARIFSSDEGYAPLAQRIADGQKSVLFAHHADYAEVTSGVPVHDPAHAFDRVAHYLLDTRLMVAWAKSLAERGEVDQARHIAARLREFRKVDAEDFFAACPDAVVLPLPTLGNDATQAPMTASGAEAGATDRPGPPFQCELPQRRHPWREFLARER